MELYITPSKARRRLALLSFITALLLYILLSIKPRSFDNYDVLVAISYLTLLNSLSFAFNKPFVDITPKPKKTILALLLLVLGFLTASASPYNLALCVFAVNLRPSPLIKILVIINAIYSFSYFL